MGKMLNLELKVEEKDALIEVLKSYLSELSNEVSHTDRLAYRNRLIAQEEQLREILKKLT